MCSVTSLQCTDNFKLIRYARDKKNITDLTLGLGFLMKVKPRQFNWDKREWYEGNKSDGSMMKETPTAGFISQELDEAQTNENADWLNLVLKDNPEKLEATYGNLLPVMVKAIQELKAEKDELKNENNEMKQRLLNLEQTQNLLVSKLEMLKSNDIVIKQVKSGGVK
ncbi:MAG: tail fiber domain-containing protein [Ignavibacteria bacterium]|nr:tail fiber domain-containing protein [Ignavibacteria bacterium]